MRFDGTSTFGTTPHTDEFNFTTNIYYEAKGMKGGGTNQSSEFSLQMVIDRPVPCCAHKVDSHVVTDPRQPLVVCACVYICVRVGWSR
jgi:hypothetical protein